MEIINIHVIVEGWVQGVFFRESTRQKAIQLGITGWVRNLPNGSVEALMSGEKSAITHMKKWLEKEGPGRVDRVIVQQLAGAETSTSFTVRY